MSKYSNGGSRGLFLRPWIRHYSSASRWKIRQQSDVGAREAKAQGLKSRAAFKLIEMDTKYGIFKPGLTVVDLGYAPGSWSQVAVERTKPHGTVVGIDLIPAHPPSGVAAFQGDFLSPKTQNLVKEYITRKSKRRQCLIQEQAGHEILTATQSSRCVNIVLSDMLMNTSGIPFRDHAGSMDLCRAALRFASDTLKPGGHFICKFYQGSEDREFEMQLKRLFGKVYREKPDASRSESKEAYFVGLRRRSLQVFDDHS